MNDYNIVFLGPSNNLTEKFRSRTGARRIVRIVQVEQLRLAGNILRDGVQIRQEVIFLLELHGIYLST
ncbi:hypothetical protein D3C81_1928890 [compost metagenome]